jgi:hypothetical protein
MMMARRVKFSVFDMIRGVFWLPKLFFALVGRGGKGSTFLNIGARNM